MHIIQQVSCQRSRTTLPRSIHHVPAKLNFIPPAIRTCPYRIVQWFYGNFATVSDSKRGYLECRIETVNVEGLVDLYRQFQAG